MLPSQYEKTYCHKCNSTAVFKYPTFNSTWREISEWYMTSDFNHWFYYCTICHKFHNSSYCCGCVCVDVYALKRGYQIRFRF